MDRIIKAIPNCPGYFASNLGEILSAWDRSAGAPGRNGRAGIIGNSLRPLNLTKKGTRWVVGLSIGTKRKAFYVHALILLTFIGERPNGMQGCHFPDKDTSNNRIDNLRWDTPKSNQADRIAHGTTNDGERNGHAKLSASDVDEILRRLGGGCSQKDVATTFGVTRSNVSHIKRGRIWKCRKEPISHD